LSADGVAGLLITGRGHFRARLTQIGLDRLGLAAVEEALSRIAFVEVPAGMVLVTFPIGEGPSPISGGMKIRTGEMITLGPGQRLHARTLGPSHWGVVRVPDEQLARYGRAVSGAGFVVPPAARWRPPRAAVRQLQTLHRAAIRMAEARAGVLTDVQAAHGLEQQLLDALIECLSDGVEKETTTNHRHRAILARFEDLLSEEPSMRTADICVALDVSERLLRECCRRHLGMGPSRYRRLRSMQQMRRALRSRTPDAAKVSEIARQHGFLSLGRLAANYLDLYGELPSATLRRATQAGVTDLTLGRPRVKVS